MSPNSDILNFKWVTDSGDSMMKSKELSQEMSTVLDVKVTRLVQDGAAYARLYVIKSKLKFSCSALLEKEDLRSTNP